VSICCRGNVSPSCSQSTKRGCTCRNIDSCAPVYLVS
jgi:hypothetical protein